MSAESPATWLPELAGKARSITAAARAGSGLPPKGWLELRPWRVVATSTRAVSRASPHTPSVRCGWAAHSSASLSVVDLTPPMLPPGRPPSAICPASSRGGLPTRVNAGGGGGGSSSHAGSAVLRWTALPSMGTDLLGWWWLVLRRPEQPACLVSGWLDQGDVHGGLGEA